MYTHLYSVQVNFIVTTSGARRRRSIRTKRLAPTEFQVYKDLAQASGGQAIQVAKYELLDAISVFLQSFSSTLVL